MASFFHTTAAVLLEAPPKRIILEEAQSETRRPHLFRVEGVQKSSLFEL